ncbi:tRNA (adenosine(37)-N6)-dimethylallyltransferase MiaA [Lactobacillus alvi]|uniref:tRNA dimethylallyltransferase n=1 Tax=Limosilactobacillus alvi TaxID=990412 RepID=A0ABS2EQQ2_9LACO|nr:tRNA (adenosine(37)-N6)-dimethylallyltransferase MiaA [Limosilactobacillus alvi]MBM6754758.1 tRNA (adenosine(37)-N6)-dimethylallyltransferase MiaA [Limosilactobacillus alvi]
MTKVLAIVGPTAVGKTALSIYLAKRLNGAVISGDSMQVYRKLDIGTAKVTPVEKAGIPHYLIDIRNVDQQFTVAEFKQEAKAKIKSISKKGQLPIIVGGTGFYLHALTNELALGNDQQESKQIRNKWLHQAERIGKQAVWDQLNQRDPEAAKKIPVQNLRRTIRALEVIEKTGKLFSRQPQAIAEDDYFIVGLTTDRQKLYARINQRVEQMMTRGLLTEARWLYDQGGEKLPAGKGIGYRELFPYFAGECSLDEAIEKIKLDSRHYAKRQLTWFRNQEDCHWFDLVQGKNQTEEIEAQVKAWLKK